MRKTYIVPRITIIHSDSSQMLAGSKWRYWRYSGDEYFERDYDERQSNNYEKLWKMHDGHLTDPQGNQVFAKKRMLDSI